MQKPVQFKISAALKRIIGSDLISDDFIAVFELVKNSYDAHASKVEITFEHTGSGYSKIIIEDNGKGMAYDDLTSKWLFVAYSAKKEGTEEDSYSYRDSIKVKRAYAGAKGIGRFSCDRLGGNLYLESTKDEKSARTEVLITDWGQFENDLKDEFVNISVLHETLAKSKTRENHGTILEITNLKSIWDRDKFLRLKQALAKLINPNTQDKDDVFEIVLNVPFEEARDEDETENRHKVNGGIENLIFKTLGLKTTKIVSKIGDVEDSVIQTTLSEGGKLVYKIEEGNSFKSLHNVDCEIYFMNRSAKSTFSRRMGLQPVEYGHIYVYKNGLRIYPYGERGEDPLKMDNRKAQGRTRYLGTREVVGFIAINEPNDLLIETTSRGDGLIKSEAYYDLVEWFYYSLRRVEKYIIDVVDWGNELSNADYIKLEEKDKQIAIKKLITNLTRSKDLITFEVSPEIFELIDNKQEKSAGSVLAKITKQIEEDSFDKSEILESIQEVEKNLAKLRDSASEAESEALEKGIKNEQLSDNLERERKKGAFKGALIGTDKERIIGLQHQIAHSSGRIHRNVKLLLKKLGPEKIDARIKKYIKVISLEASKINSIATFVTKANFNLKASEIETDLIDFVVDYLDEIYLFDDAVIDTPLIIKVERPEDVEFVRMIRPLEVTTIIDNLISNAEKETVEASEIKFQFNVTKDGLIIKVSDDGIGIPKKNLGQIFDLGFTTTDGSGIGLFQVKDIVEDKMSGKVEVSAVPKGGTIFKIIIP